MLGATSELWRCVYLIHPTEARPEARLTLFLLFGVVGTQEFTRVDPAVWQEVVVPLLGVNGTAIVAISTPLGGSFAKGGCNPLVWLTKRGDCFQRGGQLVHGAHHEEDGNG